MRLEVIMRPAESHPRPTPLLFVHGAWHGAWAWETHFLSYFAQHGYYAHALSLRGHGNSEGREGIRWHRISGYVDDVKQVADTLPSPPVVIGHSMGGFIVQKYLERYAAPAGVLMASAPSNGVIGTTLRLTVRHPLVFLKTNVLLKLYAVVETPKLAREHLFSARTPDAIVQQTHARLQDESYLGYLDMLLLNLPRPSKVSAPVMVIGASNDGVFTVGEQHATARAYGTQAVIVGDTGHNMMLEPTWQTSADHILKWLGERGL